MKNKYTYILHKEIAYLSNAKLNETGHQVVQHALSSAGEISTARQQVIKLNYYTNVAEFIKNQEDWS